jgi:hypothetical protein
MSQKDMKNVRLWLGILIIARIGRVGGTREDERNEIGLRENERRKEEDVERRRNECKLRHV